MQSEHFTKILVFTPLCLYKNIPHPSQNYGGSSKNWGNTQNPLSRIKPLGVLGIQNICHFTSRDIGYYPFYFQGYRILSILLPGIWDTVFNNLVTFTDIEYLEKIIMGIFASL